MATIPTNPDWFVYSGPIVSRYEVQPIVTGTQMVSSSPVANGWQIMPASLPVPVAVENIWLFKSFNASVPGATSQASTGSEGYSHIHRVVFFNRQDYSANSTNLSYSTSASAGVTATLGYSGTSQQFGMSWNTDASGGTSAYTTVSNAGGWSSFVTGAKFFQIPVSGPSPGKGITLSAGEWFVAHQHSSTTATSNSNVTLLSVSNLRQILQDVGAPGVMGNSVAATSLGPIGMGYGNISGITTGATMAGSVITAATGAIVMNFSNA
jgi:hypothetical protein